MTESTAGPGKLGVWGGFLARMEPRVAMLAASELEAAGYGTVWIPEWSGRYNDPFIRGVLYLSATERMCFATGVANIYARDPIAMASVASTIEEAFPGRMILGLGVSHGAAVEERGHTYERPLGKMERYVHAMREGHRGGPLPPIVIAALGRKMIELAGVLGGAHTYFTPVEHTAESRTVMGPDPFLAPSQMVVAADDLASWREGAKRFLGFCLTLPNYVKNLRRFGYTDDEMAAVTDRLVEALVVPDDPEILTGRLRAQYEAGANHVVVQLVPYDDREEVLKRLIRVGEGLGRLKA